MAGQLQFRTYAQAPGAMRTNTMQNGFGGAVITGLGLATGVGIFLLAVYGISHAVRRI